jgi:hypothetical protein
LGYFWVYNFVELEVVCWNPEDSEMLESKLVYPNIELLLLFLRVNGVIIFGRKISIRHGETLALVPIIVELLMIILFYLLGVFFRNLDLLPRRSPKLNSNITRDS